MDDDSRYRVGLDLFRSQTAKHVLEVYRTAGSEYGVPREEFPVRAQFGSFEEARKRVRCWVKDYNHRRPHQGLDGLCPADRFFEIQKELRKGIEQGIQENVQARALNRPPNEPFYMVGRMGGQSVVLSVEKGRALFLNQCMKFSPDFIHDLFRSSSDKTGIPCPPIQILYLIR